MSIAFSDIRIDPANLPKIKSLVSENSGKNPGCRLHKIWVDAGQRAEMIVGSGAFGSLDWVGMGWPTRRKLHTYDDWGNMQRHFADLDTVDINEALYQFYRILDYWHVRGRAKVLEVGGGYGRMALPFLKFFGSQCNYVSVDYVPASLLVAPQVISRFFPDIDVIGCCGPFVDATDLETYNFASIGAWQVERLPRNHFDIAINIHSFQEMDPDTFTFYTWMIHECLAPGGLFYVMNQPPVSGEYDWSGFTTLFHRVFDRMGTPTGEWVLRKAEEKHGEGVGDLRGQPSGTQHEQLQDPLPSGSS